MIRNVVDRLKMRAKRENLPVPTLYAQEIAYLAGNDAAAAAMPVLSSIDSTLYRHRGKRYPPLPHHVKR